jgi:NAD(P)H-hydrate epimerase
VETTLCTDEEVLVPSVTAAEMREIDRIAIEETGPNLYQMMENAGRNLAALALAEAGVDWRKAMYVVLAGTGGNGGGGICAARHLADRGLDVRLCLAQPDRLGSVPQQQRAVFGLTAGAEVIPAQLDEMRPTLVLDALIGYSLDGPPRGVTADLIGWANGTGAPILALDVPSGIDATTGAAPGEFVRARTTMTLALPKTGLDPDRHGAVVLADIGIPGGVYARLSIPYRSPFGPRWRVRLRKAARVGRA